MLTNLYKPNRITLADGLELARVVDLYECPAPKNEFGHLLGGEDKLISSPWERLILASKLGDIDSATLAVRAGACPTTFTAEQLQQPVPVFVTCLFNPKIKALVSAWRNAGREFFNRDHGYRFDPTATSENVAMVFQGLITSALSKPV